MINILIAMPAAALLTFLIVSNIRHWMLPREERAKEDAELDEDATFW